MVSARSPFLGDQLQRRLEPIGAVSVGSPSLALPVSWHAAYGVIIFSIPQGIDKSVAPSFRVWKS